MHLFQITSSPYPEPNIGLSEAGEPRHEGVLRADHLRDERRELPEAGEGRQAVRVAQHPHHRGAGVRGGAEHNFCTNFSLFDQNRFLSFSNFSLNVKIGGLSAGCSLLRAEGFFWSLDVLYEGLGISKLKFLIQKYQNFF